MKALSSTVLTGLLMLMLAATALAQRPFGSIVDASTGKPVPGATVSFSPLSSYVAVTDVYGDFEFKTKVPFGATLTVSHVGYWHESFAWTENITPPIRIELRPRAFLGREVTYSVDRVERKTATVPFTNVGEEEIGLRHFAQDLPVALEGIPNLTTTTDAGSGLGYSYLSLRGFDFRRVSVLLNGVMLNDPEDFYVYWVDLADFGANVQDVQVQRGAGSALLGLPAVGGTIDVSTHVYSDRPSLTAEYGLGSFNSQRASVAAQSGPIQGKYYVNGRFSRVSSDGYRDDSWSDYVSYYLSAARVDETMQTRVVLFGGPIRNHMAYAGITRAQAEADRTLNPLSYPELGAYDETDNFYQPHYQLHHDWDISDKLHLSNTLYYIQGRGYFDVYYPSWWGYGMDFWGLDPVLTSDPDEYSADWYRYDGNGNLVTDGDGNYYVDYTDALARQWVENHQSGWQPRLTWQPNSSHTVDVGGQIVVNRSRRWGEMTWAAALPAGTNPNHVWYDYQGRKRLISGYVQDRWTISPTLSVTGALQIAHIQYSVLNDKRFGAEFDQPYTFAMPRLGASWQLTDPLRVWGSISQITREPRLKDHYWAETGYPVIRYDDAANFDDPQIKPETLTDLELGLEWSDHHLFAGLTGYWMEVQDEIIDIGQYDVTGQPIIENAEKTRRLGIEASARYEFDYGWFAEGNVAVSRNRFVDYTTSVQVVNDDWSVSDSYVDLSDKRIINAPELIGNVAIGIRQPSWQARLSAHHVGERFVTNTENLTDLDELAGNTSFTLAQDRSLDAYTRVDLDASIRLLGNEQARGLVNHVGGPAVALNLHARNLLDTEYYLSGSADAWGMYVIPAATRSFFVGIKVTL